MKTLTFLSLLAGVLAATPALAAAPHERDGMLVDDQGMTLYIFGERGCRMRNRAKATARETFRPRSQRRAISHPAR